MRGLARPVRLRVSADEAALGADQPAARMLDGFVGPEQVEAHHAAMKTALRPGSAPHPQFGHMLVCEFGKRRHRSRRRVHGHFARGILAAWPVVVAWPHCSPIRPSERRLSTGGGNCYPACIRHDQGYRMAKWRLAFILAGAMVPASGDAGAPGGSTYVRQT